MNKKNNCYLVKLSTMAMMTAASCILVAMSFPFPFFPAFRYDFADIPILIATFSFGPIAALVVTAIASFIQAFPLGYDGLMGFMMHFFATGSFVVVAGVIYNRSRTRKGALIALIAGCLTMTVVMCVLNYILDPIFYGMQKEAVVKLIVPAIIPFNLTKAGMNSMITFFIYKRISKLIHRAYNRSRQA